MADIFLSYAREDQTRAEAVARALEMRGWSIFWDRGIPHGSNFRAHIQQQLESAHCILVLWSTAALASQFVLDEAAEGLEDGRLVPALIEAVRPPLGFRGLQTADLTGWDGAASGDYELERLLGSIGAIVSPGVRDVGRTTPTGPAVAGVGAGAEDRMMTAGSAVHGSGNLGLRGAPGNLTAAHLAAEPNLSPAHADAEQWWRRLGPRNTALGLVAIVAVVVWWTVSGILNRNSGGPPMVPLPSSTTAPLEPGSPPADALKVAFDVWSDLGRGRPKQDVVSRSNEYVAVVIYGSESFDVRDVDLNSVYLSDGTGSAVPAAMYHLQEGYDENHDGKDDLKLDYRVADLKTSDNKLYTSSTFTSPGG
jgi:hypothetical protein